METELDRKIAAQALKDELKAAAEKKALSDVQKSVSDGSYQKALTLDGYHSDVRSRREALLKKQRDIQAQKELENNFMLNAVAQLSFWNWLERDRFWIGLCGLLVLFCAYSFVSQGIIKDVNTYRSQLASSSSLNANAS